MASTVQNQVQAFNAYSKRIAFLTPIPIVMGFGAQRLLPSSVNLFMAVILLGIGIALSMRSTPHVIPTRKDMVSVVLVVSGTFMLIDQMSYRLLPVGALIAGVVMLAKWPQIVRKNPAAISMRREYVLAAVALMTLGIPLYIAEAGMNWNRPVLSCFALLPLVGWVVAIGITNVRVMRLTPVPDGIDEEVFRTQIAQIERMVAEFLAALPFVLVPLAVMGLIAGTMYYASVEVGAALAAASILISAELIVRKRRNWSHRYVVVAVGVLVGSLAIVNSSIENVAVSAVILVTLAGLSVDAVLSGLKRPTSWNVVPARNLSEALMFVLAPCVTVVASMLRLAGVH